MTTHPYLMDEHVHSFYPTLAERIGLNEAIVLQQIHSWIQTYLRDSDRYHEKHYHDGAWWTWDSYPDWHKKLPYLSESTIKRALKGMRELGILRVGNYNTLKIDRTYWYTIDYGAYDKLWSNPRYADQETKTESPSDQNGTMEDTNLVRPLPSISPSISASKEPPLADSPVEDSLHVPLSRLPPQDPTFWAEGETPPEPSPHEPVEQGKARRCRELGTDPLGVAAVVEKNRAREEHPDGGDASRDGDPWADKPLRAFCALVGQDIEHLKESKRKDWPRELHKWAQTYGHTVTPQEAFECIRGIIQSEYNWMTFTSPRQTTFQEVLDAMVGRFRGGDPWDAGINGKRNGSSGGRKPEPTPAFEFVDPDWLGVST